MSDGFARADEGQALVVVGLAMVVLMGALALAVDWGYGYASRRILQNEVDDATLAAARHVASTFNPGSGGAAFDATIEDICVEAASRTTDVRGTIEVSFFSDATAADPSSWTTVATTACASRTGQPVPPDTVFVRVHATQTYRSLFNVVTGQPIAVAASARARLTAGAAVRPLRLPEPRPGYEDEVPGVGVSGATTAPNVAIWPIALQYDPNLFATDPCGQYCGTSGRVVTIWPQQQIGSFHGLVTFSHDSVHDSNVVHQLLTESDYRGSAEGDQGHPLVPLFANASDPRVCGAATWDTKGGRDQGAAARCDIPNWFYYGYGGSIGIGTDWADAGWAAYRPSVPSALPANRSSCTAPPSYLATPSCEAASSTKGDWVETLNDGSNSDLTSNMAQRMIEFVQRYGRTTPASTSRGWGKAVVVHVLLWDCAEHFDGTGWTLVVRDPGRPQTCANIDGDPGEWSASVDRVHAFASVPFTFFENLIASDGSRVRAVWGNAFGEPAFYDNGSTLVSCISNPGQAGCRLNPLMNSAFLVADE